MQPKGHFFSSLSSSAIDIQYGKNLPLGIKAGDADLYMD